MAKKNCLVPVVICIFLLINLCLAREIPNSFSNDEIATTETDKELDWWYRPWFHPWFRARSWPFVHPPMPAGGFRHKFPYHPWSFMHPPRPSPSSKSEIATTEVNKELDWWYRPWFHPWFRARSWPFVHPPMPAGGFRHKFPYHPWSFMHPPRPSPSSKSEIATTEVNKELDWWYRPWFHPWFRARSWPFVHPPMPAGGFRHKFPYHPWPFMHPPRPSPSKGEKNN